MRESLILNTPDRVKLPPPSPPAEIGALRACTTTRVCADLLAHVDELRRDQRAGTRSQYM